MRIVTLPSPYGAGGLDVLAHVVFGRSRRHDYLNCLQCRVPGGASCPGRPRPPTGPATTTFDDFKAGLVILAPILASVAAAVIANL